MTVLTKRAIDVFAPTTASGALRGADMAESMIWGTEVERGMEGAAAGRVDQATWAGLTAIVGTRPGQPAIVFGPDAGTHTDPVTGLSVPNVGEYYWSASPAGWRRAGNLQRTLVHALNTGAGTANAVQGISDVQFSQSEYAALITVNFVAANTGPMTISINGETPRPLVTNTGAAIPAGYVTADMSALVQIDADGNYRLFSYGDATAIQEAAEAAQVAAEAARDAALAAVPNAFPVDLAGLKALNTSTVTSAYLKQVGRGGQFAWRTGDYSTQVAADTEGGVFIKADAVAATVGAWVRIDTMFLEPRMFGASPAASAAQNATAFLACATISRLLGLAGFFIVADSGAYNLTAGTNLANQSPSNVYNGLQIIGIGRPKLVMQGSGEGLVIRHTGTSSNEYRYLVDGLIIQGGPTITDVFSIEMVNHSTFRGLETREGLRSGFRVYKAVCNHWEQCTGGNGAYGPQTTVPAFGWLRDSDNASTYIQCKGENLPATNENFLPSAVDVAANTITLPSTAKYPTGTKVWGTTNNSMPLGFTANTPFYVIQSSATTIKLAASYANAVAGTAVDIQNQGAGTHTLIRLPMGVAYINSDWCADIAGTYESCAVGAEIMDDDSSMITFFKTDFEANTHYDLVTRGHHCGLEGGQITSSVLGKGFHVVSGTMSFAAKCYVRGAFLEPGTDAHFNHVSFSEHVALGIQGTGSYTTYGCVKRSDTNFHTIVSRIPDRTDSLLLANFFGVGVSAIPSTRRVLIRGLANTSATGAFRVQDGLDRVLFDARDDGIVALPNTYDSTDASPGNMVMLSGGLVKRSTSAAKYKKWAGEIEPWMLEAYKAITGFLYRPKGAPDDSRLYLGLYADDFHEAGLTMLVEYGEDGQVEGLHYERCIVLERAVNRQQEERLDILEGKLASLEARMGS